VPREEIAAALSLSEDQVGRVIADIERKRRATDYLRAHPINLDPAE